MWENGYKMSQLIKLYINCKGQLSYTDNIVNYPLLKDGFSI